MKRDEALKFLPIIEAWGNGKVIQFRDGNYVWHDNVSDTLAFCSDCDEYRIKEDKLQPLREVVKILTIHIEVASTNKDDLEAHNLAAIQQRVISFIKDAEKNDGR